MPPAPSLSTIWRFRRALPDARTAPPRGAVLCYHAARMSSSPGADDALYDLVVRAVMAFERDGEVALAQELVAAGELAPRVRQQIDSMRQSGLLQEPARPERIGDFRVLQRLGSGGMGSVFLCEQDEPVRRRVAVKVMRPGMDSAAIVARFRLERQALAALDHPNIAKLLDAGTTEDGRPFLVMEYVAGMPLHRYCDERQLDARARLELFARICDAVQHAHHKGLVHRDLKPSNVLVLDRDGSPWPMVIDFGVAKSLAQGASLGTLLTLPGAMLGTPEYMSPEQATHEIDVDTRADVYSLGVVLYELLTGTLPIERERLRGNDIARVLGSTEPPTPSTRLTSLGEAAGTIAQHRRTDLATLRRFVRGDLDWVVMKAIEKDRNRRYGMPAELAADVRRFLASEPVSAGPVSSWYRLRKLCARNRPQAVAVGAALSVIVVGLLVSTWFWRDAAASSRARTASLDDAMSAVGELVVVGDSDLVDVPHLAAVRRGLLQKSLAIYQRFVDRTDVDDPSLAPRIADAQIRLGCLQLELGEHGAAAATLRAAEQLAARPEVHGVAVTLRARGLAAFADASERLGDSAAAAAATAAAERLLRAAFAADPTADTREALLRTLTARARHVAALDQLAGLTLAAEAVTLATPFVDGSGSDPRRWPWALRAHAEAAQRAFDLGRRDEAIAELDQALALWQRSRTQTVDPGTEWRLTTAIGEIAGLFARADTYGRMIDVLAATEAVYTRLVADHPAVLTYRSGLGRTRLDKAIAELRNQRLAHGLATALQAERGFAEALAQAPADPTLLYDACLCANLVATSQLEAQRLGGTFDLAVARAARERAAAHIEVLATTPGGAGMAVKLRMEERRLFALLHEPPEAPEALAALAAAIALADEAVNAEPNSTELRERRIEMRTRHGKALRTNGDAVAAQAVLLAALAEQDELRGRTMSPEIFSVRRQALRSELARVAAALGDIEAVLEHVQDYLAVATNVDWGGKLNAGRLLVEFAKGPLSAQAERVLAAAREVMEQAFACGDAFGKAGAPDASPAMLAAMRANTWAVVVDIERAAGDGRAEVRALGEIAACRAETNAQAGSDRSRSQLHAACTNWLQRLLEVDDAATAPAAERIAVWCANDSSGLLAAARVLGRHVAADAAAGEAREAGRLLLARALAAGADAGAIDADAELRALRAR